MCSQGRHPRRFVQRLGFQSKRLHRLQESLALSPLSHELFYIALHCFTLFYIVLPFSFGLREAGRSRLFQATALMIVGLHGTMQLEDTILHLLEVHVPPEDPIQTLLQILTIAKASEQDLMQTYHIHWFI